MQQISTKEYKTIHDGREKVIHRELYHHQNHHHAVPLAGISLAFSRHFSLSFLASGRSSRLHPVSSHGCCIYVRAGRPAFARPYAGVHRSTLLMSLSLLLQQCPACLVCLTWIVWELYKKFKYDYTNKWYIHNSEFVLGNETYKIIIICYYYLYSIIKKVGDHSRG